MFGCIKQGKVVFFPFDLGVDPAKGNTFCNVWIGLLFVVAKSSSIFWYSTPVIIKNSYNYLLMRFDLRNKILNRESLKHIDSPRKLGPMKLNNYNVF